MWFSPVSPASSTTKTGRLDIAEIFLKVALSTKNQIKVDEHEGEQFWISRDINKY